MALATLVIKTKEGLEKSFLLQTESKAVDRVVNDILDAYQTEDFKIIE